LTKPIAGLIKRVGPIDSSGQPKWWLFARANASCVRTESEVPEKQVLHKIVSCDCNVESRNQNAVSAILRQKAPVQTEDAFALGCLLSGMVA